MKTSRRSWTLLAFALVACALIYAPGLNGSLALDDFTFILANVAMHVKSLRFADWFTAAMSFPAGSHQGRWLGMLSFAANHYFTGLDPYWLKLTNLAIHLVNGVLVFLALRTLFELYHACRRFSPTFDGPLAAATLAALWLVLPINLTAVLYVSQRLESLSNTFVFLGLWWYLCARLAYWRGEAGYAGLWLSLVIATGVGVLVKESAITLPLYALCIEFVLTGARQPDGRRSQPIFALYALLIALPAVIGAVWLASWIGGENSYARPFSTIQRLMTEARVMVDYMRWTLLPQPESLTLFHDDFAVSRGLLQPPSTLACIIGLLGLIIVALLQRSRRPLFTLGVLWFFAGHLLTGTVIPLMLVFEHRNYFPSMGLVLAAASLVPRTETSQSARLRTLLAACVFAFYGFVTWMRAEEWSDPLRFALSEASKRPNSPAAQYELARTLLHSFRKDDGTPMVSEAFKVLEHSYRLPGADTMHEQLLIVGHAELGEPVDPAWWASLISKLRSRPPTTSDIDALGELLRCTEAGTCKEDPSTLQSAFEASVSHPSTDRALLTYYGDFVTKFENNPDLAEKQFREAVAKAPTDPMTHSNLFAFLVHVGKLDEARKELAKQHQLNDFGALDHTILGMEEMLRKAGPAARGELAPLPQSKQLEQQPQR